MITPDQVELNPPAKNPYVMENTVRRAIAVCDDSEPDDAMPQNRSTDNAEPSEDKNMTLITEKRSHRTPRAIPPKMDVALTSERNSVPVVWDSPTVPVE